MGRCSTGRLSGLLLGFGIGGLFGVLLVGGCRSSAGGGDKEKKEGFQLVTDEAGGSFSLTHEGYPSIALTGFAPAIRVGDEVVRCGDFSQRKWETLENKGGWRLTCEGHGAAPDLTLLIERTQNEDALALRASIKGPVDDFRGFEVIGAGGGLSVGTGEPAWLSNGYQSWSPSGALKVAAAPTDEELDAALRLRGKMDESRTGQYVSWWYTAVATKGGPALVLGATTADVFKSAFSVYKEGAENDELTLKVFSGLTGESVSAQDGETITSESFSLMVGDDPWPLLRTYAESFAPSRTEATAGAVGWNSWYCLFTGVTAEDVKANAEAAAQKLKGEEPFTIVVDDGWEKEWGLWEPNEKFPDGMAAVAEDIKAKGLIPGLWLAPLLADDQSALITQHPDWFVKDESGAPLTYPHANGAQQILDVTHPDAAAFIGAEVEKAVGWGFEMLKLDFLFVGAYEGVRNQQVTGTQAYEIALDLLRTSMGEDVYFLACGAPLLSGARPVQYDAIRTGADIAFEAIGPSWSFVATQLRQTAARSFLNGLAFEVDPDPPIVRATDGDAAFTADEAWSMVVSVLVSGGLFFASDEISVLEEDRLALLTDEAIATIRALPNPTAAPVDMLAIDDLPEDRLVDPVADHFKMKTTTPGGTQSRQPHIYKWDDGAGGVIVALFAFQPDGETIALPVEKIGLDGSASWTVSALGPGPDFTIEDAALKGALAGHQAALVRIVPAK